MQLNTYQALAMRTAKPLETSENLMHAALGVSGEAGEFCDAIKKHLVYGQRLDVANAMEELGDLCWFIALACQTLNVPMEHVARMNIDKLSVRYPEQYTDLLAAERLDKEV
jgi:NTP pyrophosphatase (non-canonical NTP hydrolase)